MEGVVAYLDKDDIPGRNTFIPKEEAFVTMDEELFCSGTVLYHSQPIGILVAETQEIAQAAADTVEVTYADGKEQPLYTIREVLKANAKEKIVHEQTLDPKTKGKQLNSYLI